MATGTNSMVRKSLPDMNAGELNEILEVLKIPYNQDDTNAVKVQRIQESGKYNVLKETGAGKVTANEAGVQTHPTLGEYIKVEVFPVGTTNQNTSIFVSINYYTVEFQPREQIMLPIRVVEFLEAPTIPQHYYDPNVISENGNKGAHMTRYIPKYIIKRVA